MISSPYIKNVVQSSLNSIYVVSQFLIMILCNESQAKMIYEIFRNSDTNKINF